MTRLVKLGHNLSVIERPLFCLLVNEAQPTQGLYPLLSYSSSDLEGHLYSGVGNQTQPLYSCAILTLCYILRKRGEATS